MGQIYFGVGGIRFPENTGIFAKRIFKIGHLIFQKMVKLIRFLGESRMNNK
jgi:hypothetical protein